MASFVWPAQGGSGGGYSGTTVSSGTLGLTPYLITANQFGDLTSISLTAGTWDIFCWATFYSNGATGTPFVGLGIFTTSGNNAGTEGVDFVLADKSNTTTTRTSLSFYKMSVVVPSTTTYYLKGRANTSITNLQVGYNITARSY